MLQTKINIPEIINQKINESKNLWMVIAGVLFIIGLEYLYARKKGKKIFRFQNTISNLLMGVFDRIAGIFMVPFIYLYYYFLHQNFSLFDIPNTISWFLVACFLSDFIWYFYHRAGHRVNVFWAAHIIHHQSEDYNYSVALNLTPFQVLIRVAFWSLMPVIGFSAETVLGTHLCIGAYQFLLHTTLIPKLGIIEKIFVTPSHHRVHHGSNGIYLDKNYGGVLIIWDKLFGSFQAETEPVKYGITKDINSRDFLKLVFHYYQNLLYLMRKIRSLKEKILVFLKGPDWQPQSSKANSLPIYIEKGSYSYQNYTPLKKFYILFNVFLVLIGLAAIPFFAQYFIGIDFFILTFCVFLTLIMVGRLLEHKKINKILALKIVLLVGWFVWFFKII